jgi:hypothetical protein
MLLNRAIENVFRSKNEITREQILAKLPPNYTDFMNVTAKSGGNRDKAYCNNCRHVTKEY